MVHLVRKTSVDLPGPEVCFSGLRTSFSTRWLKPDMPVVELSDRFSTINLYVVTPGEHAMHCVDLSTGFDEEVRELAEAKRPLSPDMGADCALSEAVLKGDQVQIPPGYGFQKEAPKNSRARCTFR